MTVLTEKDLFTRYASAGSEAMFDFPCEFFRLPECMGVVPYRIEFNCVMVFGGPICPSEEVSQLTQAFHQFCDASNLNIIYIIVSEDFAKWAINHNCHILIEACKELILNPQEDFCRKSHRLKHRVENAIQYGLTFHEYFPKDKEIEDSLMEVGAKWQRSRKSTEIFLGHLNFFEHYEGKRWFYVKENNRVTGMTMLSKVESSEGWLLKFLMTVPEAFHYTSEFLMVSLLELLKNENCHFLTKGAVPINDLGEIQGLGRFTQKVLKMTYKIISKIFKFDAHKAYWLRYHPKVQPAYLVFYRPQIGINELRALMKVFRTSLKH